MSAKPWVAKLRALHDKAFDIDWEEHVDALNIKHGLAGIHQLETTPVSALPPT